MLSRITGANVARTLAKPFTPAALTPPLLFSAVSEPPIRSALASPKLVLT